ncbi:nucleoside triphosphate pyrophosphohydrolase family protein [bacterium]|nr:nucleoside triphosphate pyrophosphohydrolase family protein [bacterium]
MSMNEYQEMAEKTSGAGKDGERRMIIAALGLAGEAGEFANMIKKLTAHGHDIPTQKLAEELGDVMWYVAEAATACGLTLNEIAAMNIEKLQARYPEGFSEEASRNRKI